MTTTTPTRPAWHAASAGYVDDAAIMYEREFGQVGLGNGPTPDPEDGPDTRHIVSVYLVRRDWLADDGLHTGPVEVVAADYRFTPAQARELAGLLTEAADLAEQS